MTPKNGRNQECGHVIFGKNASDVLFRFIFTNNGQELMFLNLLEVFQKFQK